MVRFLLGHRLANMGITLALGFAAWAVIAKVGREGGGMGVFRVALGATLAGLTLSTATIAVIRFAARRADENPEP